MSRRHKAQKNHGKKQLRKTSSLALPFIEHVHELKRRLFYVAVSIGIGSLLAYAVHKHIIALLLAPSKGQEFIYTSPGGGFNFLLMICIYTGIVFSLPVIVYQLLRYFEPMIRTDSMKFIMGSSVASGILATAGIVFGYLVGLPSAMNFLLQSFNSEQIRPLITIQSYMSFVSLYLFGSALLLQLPLIVLLVNHLKTLNIWTLIKMERWVILSAFILGALISPSPNWLDQVILAGPMIGTYQVAIAFVWFANRKTRRPRKVYALLKQDAEIQAARLEKLRALQRTWHHASAIGDFETPKPILRYAEALSTPNSRPTNSPRRQHAPLHSSTTVRLAAPKPLVAGSAAQQSIAAPSPSSARPALRYKQPVDDFVSPRRRIY